MTSTYLLGAGASIEAGVPAANKMARRLYDELQGFYRTEAALNVVIGGLRQRKAVIQGDPFADIDVEDLYAALTLLARRDSDILAPFVASWSAPVLAADQPDPLSSAANIVRALKDTTTQPSGRYNVLTGQPAAPSFHGVESALVAALSSGASGEQNIFAAVASKLLDALIQVCTLGDNDKVRYLEPLVSSDAKPVWIATLNYDNSIELAAENRSLSVDLGLREDGTVQLEPQGSGADICLAKLHGSVDWYFEHDGALRRTTPRDPHIPYGKAPALVFGSGNKLQVRGPYLDLLFAFRARLELTTELHVCGYSFRDEHINQLLTNWLTRETGRTIHVYDPAVDLGVVDYHLFGRTIPWREDKLPFIIHNKKASEWLASMAELEPVEPTA